MPAKLQPKERLARLFLRRKCWLLTELVDALGYAPISVRRLLTKVGYFRSYTHNGKWYTLASAPAFDRDGIWCYRQMGFSKHRSLTATIVHLVQRSPAGLSAKELEQKLRHPCHAVLTQLHNRGALDRVKFQNQFRYLCVQQPSNRRQRDQLALESLPRAATELSAQAALFVLIEHIKQPGLSFEQIAEQVHRRHHISVAPSSIGRLFESHGLKKTAPAPKSQR